MFTGMIASPIIFSNETTRQGLPLPCFRHFLKLSVAVLICTRESSIIYKIFLKGTTTMAVKTFALNINTVTMHGVDTRYWYSSGLYCRTQISVWSVIGL